jgi:hypothetical protein
VGGGGVSEYSLSSSSYSVNYTDRFIPEHRSHKVDRNKPCCQWYNVLASSLKLSLDPVE